MRSKRAFPVLMLSRWRGLVSPGRVLYEAEEGSEVTEGYGANWQGGALSNQGLFLISPSEAEFAEPEGLQRSSCEPHLLELESIAKGEAGQRKPKEDRGRSARLQRAQRQTAVPLALSCAEAAPASFL